MEDHLGRDRIRKDVDDILRLLDQNPYMIPEVVDNIARIKLDLVLQKFHVDHKTTEEIDPSAYTSAGEYAPHLSGLPVNRR